MRYLSGKKIIEQKRRRRNLLCDGRKVKDEEKEKNAERDEKIKRNPYI